MTEEELREEATSTVEWESVPMIDRPLFVFAYVKGAEPREKRIAELEAQIEKMKCCGNCKHFDFNEPNYCHKGVYRERQYVCNKWEFLGR